MSGYRHFITRLAVVSLLTGVPACGPAGPETVGPSTPDQPPPPPPRPPSPVDEILQVELIPSGLELDDSVTVHVTGDGIDRVVVLSPGFGHDMIQFRIPPGRYVVALEDAASNCTPSRAADTGYVVLVGQTTVATFAMHCRPTGALVDRWLAVERGDSTAVLRGDSLVAWVPGGAPAWSGDGRRLALAKGQRIQIFLTDNLYRPYTSLFTMGWADDLAWSPADGPLLYFNCIESEYWWEEDCSHELWMATEGQTGWDQRRISDLPLWTPAWAPDGHLGVAAGYRSLEGFGPDGASLGPMVARDDVWQLFGPSFSPDGRRLAYLEWKAGTRRQQPRVLDLTTGSDEAVKLSWWGDFWQILILPDGRLLLQAYASGTGSRTCLFVTEPDGSWPRLLVSCEIAGGRVAVAPR